MNIVMNKPVALSYGLIPMAPMLGGCTAVVWLNFDAGGNVGQPVLPIPNLGNPDIKVSVVAKNGGQILVASGQPKNGQALNFPDHDGAESGPRAVLKVVDDDLADGDALSPGLANFAFGADFKLDATSASTQYDDGNNLIQRGLKGSSAQYKIQVDSIPVINLTWPLNAPVVPMSIGGKLHADGTIASQSDQFNGLIDNAGPTLL